MDHQHRDATPGDFEGKTILRVDVECDNIWRFWFTDGTAFAIQFETTIDGFPVVELCDVCVEEPA